MKRRVLSFSIALALCLNLLPAGAFAAGTGTDGGLCPHHPAHTDACGYAAPVLGQECAHRHDESCYTAQTSCVHEHTAECYPDSDSGSDAEGPVLCAHRCTQDSGCITQVLSCSHEHDGACGYVPENPGAPCTFVCAVCPIEALIRELPRSVSADNAEQVQAQVEEIYTLYDELTGDEQQQVDLSPCAALLEQMAGSAALSVDGITETYIFEKDMTYNEPYVIKGESKWIDTNGFTMTGGKTDVIQVEATGKLYLTDLKGGGEVISLKGAGVAVQSGGFLCIEDPGPAIQGKTYALDIAAGAEVHLSVGTYTGGIAAIRVADGNFGALLEQGYTFFDEDGNRIPAENMAAVKTFTVGACTDHSVRTYKHDSGTTAHTWTCSACKETGTEPCTFDFAQNGTGTCACHNGLKVVVDESDLSDLVYDGTLKPEQVGVTVTLTDGSNQKLVKDTDFTVHIEKITDAGQATVTVTGITFNGTFVRTYTVEQDEPGIDWNNTDYSVDYDGSVVTAGELPNITITIKSSEDLHPLLKYAYKKAGDADFTDGLPTDAGTYQVKAYLEESQNYEAAETDPLLALTINQIDPIATAPAARTLTYNRSAQALVTAGKLSPVAVGDGLEIQFATEENGTYSTDIPTGTNAGNYTVWYQVVGLTNNYIAPNPNPVQVSGVEIQRKSITPVVTLSQYSYLYDGGYKEPAVTVKDDDHVTLLPDTEYSVAYENNRNVSTDVNPAKVVVTDKIPNGGNYTLEKVEVEFKITSKTQDTLSITNKPATFTYGDKFTLQTSGGSGNGDVTWEIVPADPDNPTAVAATVDQYSGQVTITGHGSVTVKATKSGKDPATDVVNYEDATAVWTFTADKKPVTATVTAEDKDYDGSTTATVKAVVESGVLTGDEITITGLTGTFSDENAGVDKTVTVVVTDATITGKNSEHYDVSYSATTVKATIHKAVAKITTLPVPATLTYNGMAQKLIGTAAVVDPNSVLVEYALSKTGPYTEDFPVGTNAGTYTVWYRIRETVNYTGLDPESVSVTIAQKPVSPTIMLDQDTFVYDGTAKEPVVTLTEVDGTTVIPAGEYTVEYSGNINVGTATVTVTAKADGNYTFENAPVTANFTISQKQAQVLTAPEAAGDPLTFNTRAQKLVTAGAGSGGIMVYRVGDTGDFESAIPTETNAAEYTVYYKVQGDGNHSDSNVGSVKVTIAPKTVKDPTIELFNADDTPLVSYTYDGSAKEPKVEVKDGSTVITDTEYNVVYSDNRDAGKGTVNITDRPGGNYTVTGSATFVIEKANIVFNPAPSAAILTYNGTAQELLTPGTTTGGEVQYALGSPTTAFTAAIPQATLAGNYTIYYKVVGDKNHNDLNDLTTQKVEVTIQRKPLTSITIELTPGSFQYDGKVHLPTVTVKDGDTVLPASEYTWACDNNAPTQGGIYTITVSDKDGGNYDLTSANPNTATFTIGKAPQAELVIEGKREHVYYGDSFKLSTSGGSSTGGLTWTVVGGNATIGADDTITITGVGEVSISVVKAGDTNYEQTSAHWTFTAEPKPVTATVTVNNKPYDGTTAATVDSADITTINSDMVTIDPASITAAFDDPHAGTGKTVTLDTSKVQVTGDDAAKYDISYPAAVTADVTQATTTITTAPAAITPLTYTGQPQALVTAGVTNVGFLVYSLSENGEYSQEIPTGTNAGDYTVYYKVDETDDYTGVAMKATPISVTITPKSITPKIELSESSFKYDGTKKNPAITVKDDKTVIDPDQYTVTWANADGKTTTGILTAAGTYTATITNVTTGNNYTFNVTASVEITPAEQAALHITGNPEHVYYGDAITTLGTTGGTGEGTVKWSVTAGAASIVEGTGVLTITGTGAVTVRAERSVPNYGTVGDNWNFTVEPKPVMAEVTVAAKTYDGTTDIADTAITAQVKAADLVGSDTVTLSGLKGVYEDANAGTGKTVTLDSTGATADNTDKYTVTYPATTKGDINPRQVGVTVTLSDHDLKQDTNGYFYTFDGTAKTPTVTVTGTDGSYSATLAASDYSVDIIDNKNVGNAKVKVTAKTGGNYTFADATVNFGIRSAAAVLTSSPQGKDLTYDGTAQELVTVGAATGGTVVYSESLAGPYEEKIPTQTAAGTYTVYYKVDGDDNHTDTEPKPVSATIKPKEITPAITLGTTSYVYDGIAKTPTVTVKDGETVIDGPGTTKPEYSISYRDNVNVGTATVTVSDANGGNYIVNGTATFEITKAAPTATAPTGKTGLYYTGEVQDLVNAGVTSEGTVVYSVNGGNYSPAIPAASAVGTYTIDWKVLGDGNHSDTTPVALSPKVEIAKNTVTNPTISLSSNTFKYNGNQQKPTITVYDNHSRVIPEREYTIDIKGTNGNVGMVDVDTYTVTIVAAANSNYEFQGTLTRTFEIVAADQETISITGTQAQVYYGNTIQLGATGGTGGGTTTWTVAAKDGGTIDSTISATGLLTVKDVNTPITVTVTRTRANYGDVSATWEFTAGKKPVTAVVTAADRNYIDGNRTATVTASVPNSELVSGDSITITGLTGTFDNPNVGTDKKVTVNSSNPTVTGTNSEKYDITYPAVTTASILGVTATVDTEPAANTLTYNAAQAQALVTAGSATGGIMVYSLDGNEFTPNIPKGKDAGTYTVYYKAQGDQNHTDSAVGTVDVTITQQSVTPQIELSPPSGQYDGKVQQPAVTVRDTANNVIPDSEYKVTYVTDNGANWTDQGTYMVKVENITGGNYEIRTATKDFTISTTAQAPLEIVNKPGHVYYGDSFTLSTSGGSSSQAVTWSSSNTSIADIDENGLVTIKGVGSATITATKAGGGNYDEAEATYPLNALKKPVTAVVTADDKVYDGNTNATIHVTWSGLVGNDTIDTSGLTGAFGDANVGANKTVTITGTPTSDTTSQKYDITIPDTTSASITKATATAPTLTANTLTYTGSAQALVTGGDTNTLYSGTRDGVYTATVPTGTNAGTYTVWYKAQGDANHNDSEPQAIEVTINPKTLTLTDANVTVELTGNDLKTDTTVTPNVYYYEYDGTDKKPTVIIKDGAAQIPSSEYTVTYSDNKNVGTNATVTIADNEGGNYNVSGNTTFEIRKGGAQLITYPQARVLTYTGQNQELVTGGTATGGHVEYQLTSAPTGETTSTSFSTTIPTGTNAGTYTVEYKVVGDDNHEDNPTVGSVTVTIQPKTVISPKITVTGTYTYDGTEQKPAGTAVTVVDGTTTINTSEYTLSYQNNVNVGTATVIVTDNNGGNYTVSGTATFEIGKAAAAVGTAPTGKTDLKYNGTAQELLDTQGTATGGTMVYSLSETGEYSAAIPTGKAVGEYEVWYMVQGDANHSDTMPAELDDKVKIDKNTVTNPTINVEPASVKYTGEKQEPTVTVKDDDGLLIDGSEYTPTYLDENNNNDLTAVGTYTVTITEVANGNYIFNTTKTATFTITPADQTPLTITGTRERVYYGDTVPLGTTGGIDGGTVTWDVGGSTIATIDANGLLKITGTGSVTVTATSKKTGYADQTATWNLYADKKPVTALVTAAAKTYDSSADATVTATLQASDFVGTDSFTITLTGCTFEDSNAGTDKKVNVVSSNPSFTVNTGSADNHENYAITYPATATASIFKADIAAADVTAPAAVTGLIYTGLPLELVTAGTVTGGTMEYSVDGTNYSTSLPTGTDAGNYDVWYRVKGDGNHNDTTGTKLTETAKITIAKQTVTNPTIEFNPTGATYDSQEHKPAVKVLDANGRVIPDSEYTVDYGSTNWKDVGEHTVTITGKTDGNYSITGTPTKTFTILSAGQSPLSIVGQPGEVRYGDSFTLSVTGGSGTGALTWESSDDTVVYVNSATGRVEIKKAGGPVTITARKAAGGGYSETTATWTFSAEKRPATAIVTARNKPYDSNTTAVLDISWKDGDLLGNDSITLSLTGAFDDANVGENKIVRITRNGDLPDSGGKYAVTYNTTTTASITAQAATVSGVQSGPWTYSGNEISLLQGGAATNGTIVYSRNGVDFMETSPTETNAGKYTVYYKARGNTNYADSDVRMVEVTIQPETVTNPVIELSSDSFEYDGTAKEPDVLAVKDGSNVIPASEYTVSYRNNTAVGTATVTITDVAGGNYTVNGSKTFTIKAGAPALTAEPQPRDLTYNGRQQTLVTRGTAVNGHMEYSLDEYDDYSTTLPKETDAGVYEVWYKVVSTDGTTETEPESVIAEIQPKPVNPTVTVNLTSDPLPYTGSAQKPSVTVVVESKTLTQGTDYAITYSNNTNPGTATVTVTSIGGNYQFSAQTTFEIAKSKAKFLSEPKPVENLVYTGEEQELVTGGASQDGLVLYSLDAFTFSASIPTKVDKGSYTVYAKVQGSSKYEDSDLVSISVQIGINEVKNPTVELSATSFPYTGSTQKPTVTLSDDDGNVIAASEYRVTYTGDTINPGKYTLTITSRGKNYSFADIEREITITDASQTPLAITGKKDTVYYGDTLSLGTTGGGSDTVTWSSSDTDVADIDASSGVIQKIKTSGSVTITATKGSLSDTWTFYAQPKPVTALVTAANKVYDGNNTATLTVTLSGLLPGETVDSVTAQGQFSDETVGTNKNVVITALTVPDAISKKYDISYNNITTASITPKPAAVTAAPTLTTGPLTYNGGAQALLASDGTADNGNLMYSLDGLSYSYTVPTGTDAKTYTVWYKVEAADDNHKDSAAVKLGDMTIAPNMDTPSVLCTPSTIQYDGTEQTPAVVVRDSANRIIPESEYTVTWPTLRIAVGTYTVTITDKAGGNYKFDSPVTGTFEIVAASQNPLSIVTDIPTNVSYGDSFRLSAMGGSGSGAVQWSIEESSVATINANGVVTVTGTGGFTVKAYRAAADGYSQSNTDSVPFVANPKAVTPVVTASDKNYDGKTDATLTATWKSGDLVGTDTIALTVNGAFDTADAGTDKRVSVIGNATGTDTTLAKYAITWPDSTKASIYKVDAKLTAAPAGADLTYTRSAQNLVTAGTTENNIGTVVYSTSQNGAYSETIPTGTNAGTYTVWYKVADSVNYTGIAPAAIGVEIKKATPNISTSPTASGTAGQKLSEIIFSNGGAAGVPGKFAWESPETVAVAGTAYNVIFTPTDTANYNTVTIQVTAVSGSSNGTNGGGGSSNGGGGSSGNGSDSGTNSTPPAGTDNTPSADENDTQTQTTIENGTASTVMSAADGDQLVKEAVRSQSQRIVIKPEITSDVTKAQVSIPASTVSQIQSETSAALTVSTPIADTTLSRAALDTLSSAGGDVSVATEQAGQAVVLTLTADGETVEHIPGGLTLTIPAEDAGPGAVAVLVNDDGTREIIQKSMVEEGKMNIPLNGSATVEIVDNSKAFDDVPPTSWAAEAVTFASARELFNGTSETTFSPEETTTRGMVATVLYRLEGQPDQALASAYSDVSGDAWYADSVAWAAENGIVNGYGDGQFGPNDSVTREQFVVMLWRYVGSPEAEDHDLAFTDADQVNSYAHEALCWAVENGVLNGNGSGQLLPGGTTTRAEAAQMLKNFMENIS